MSETDFVWVFQGERASFPSAIFSSKKSAVQWIEQHNVSGMLSKYPLDVSVYEWSIASGFFKPRKDDHRTSEFIQSFSSACVEDSQYIDGIAVA
ncbi:hypothetical protein CMUST_14950 [Corynebacterium mustelae]|uniref:DUF7710 domain-containing protein n=1 Tax=Corynebacterium mustelae TaxID=571915 RepID=A0A0G3H1J2_9CORY|nr:hypothetical protein [Corynebacterium mustelae]AKK07279.1 hypothetical protein CMUST_14950 [Corynebacterium mustelae]